MKNGLDEDFKFYYFISCLSLKFLLSCLIFFLPSASSRQVLIPCLPTGRRLYRVRI